VPQAAHPREVGKPRSARTRDAGSLCCQQVRVLCFAASVWSNAWRSSGNQRLVRAIWTVSAAEIVIVIVYGPALGMSTTWK